MSGNDKFFRRALLFNWTSRGRIENEAFFFCKMVREKVSTLLSREEKHILPCSHSSTSTDHKVIKSLKIIESRIPKIPQFQLVSDEPISEVGVDVVLVDVQR